MGGPAHLGIQGSKRSALRAERHACSPGVVARACTHAAISARYAQAAHAAALALQSAFGLRYRAH